MNEKVIRVISVACHEVNRAWCLAHGDKSQPHWEDLDGETRASAHSGVRGAIQGNTPEQSHTSWLEFKGARGWKYGPGKSPDDKLHPCMVPYEELSDDQKMKDHLFISTVRQMGMALNVIDE